MNDVQWQRKATLYVLSDGELLDLSDMHFTFQVLAADAETPNTCRARIYNLSDDTSKRIRSEFTGVVLQAGYESGAFGQIFKGTIKQYATGRENNVDRYLDLLCADGDLPYNFGFVSQSLAAGASQQQIFNAVNRVPDSMGYPVAVDAAGMVGGIAPSALARGKVLFGLYRDYQREWAEQNGFRWSIQQGEIVLTPIRGYRPGQAVQLNSQTGLIGVPEATEGGVMVRALLNPMIRCGALVQINNRDINTLTVREQGFPSYTALTFPATVTADGYYRVLVSEFEGDTRGQSWYTNMTCLAVDPSAAPDNCVAEDGW